MSIRFNSEWRRSAVIAVLLVTAIYLYIFPAPSLFYIAVVLLHAFLGACLVFTLILKLWRMLSAQERWQIDWMVIMAAGVVGVVLLFIGATRPHWLWMYTHIALSFLGVALLAVRWSGSWSWLATLRTGAALRTTCFLGLAVALVLGGWKVREGRWLKAYRVVNPLSPPSSMDLEGDTSTGPFFPSSAQTTDGKKILAEYFTESDACERCHKDIYRQWSSSAHHFSSFNNQWYRKSIEYMQDGVGVKPSKWCAGCHDPALLFSGLFDTPIKQIVDRKEAQAGLGCMMCHSIVKVKSSMGQGDFTLDYPRLHELAASRNPVVRWLHDYVTYLNPEPHRRVFMKPFMRQQTAEFCSTCHKVHLDSPVNHYRWIRGFNEYDNWQASGVSGQGARSFYYPPQPSQCADCHMPLVQSADAGGLYGNIHSHAFPAANTALPVANGDAAQLELTKKFLKDSVTVDIFAIAPASARKSAAETRLPEMATMFAVGEEAESPVPHAVEAETPTITAPLNRVSAKVRRGDTVRVDVVVRTRKVGHFFPAGTVDAYDTWLELKGTDDHNHTIFWSGKVEDDGHGPVEEGAHFYRSLQVDGRGNPINKRNAWASRAVVYVRLIPPGAADTVHYRLRIPADAGDHVTLQARLCYRKFAWFYTQFSYAGVPEPAQPAAFTPDYDDRHFIFTGSTAHVSGNLKQVPDLPVFTISQDAVTLVILAAAAPLPQPEVVLHPEDWTRWNDYGIGLFLQGDLKGASSAFEQITRMDAANADAWINMGRVALQEGNVDRAGEVLQKALQLRPGLARANYFYARVLRAQGRYDEGADRLHKVLLQYPFDRVARNDLGRLRFLQRRFSEAVDEFKQVLSIDPEDLQAHYNLMLCYQGLGQEDKARAEKKLYLRFKVDESAQALTGNYRRLHPRDNNERQTIHEHESVPVVDLQSPVTPSTAGKTMYGIARPGSLQGRR